MNRQAHESISGQSLPPVLVSGEFCPYGSGGLHSVAFEILGFQIYWYGILAAAGVLAGLWTASRRAPQAGIRGEEIYNLAPWILLGTVFGARLLYVATHWRQEFAGQGLATIFNVRSGLVYYGGLIGASLAVIVYCRARRLPLWRIGDVFAPSVALGHAFGRIGCLMTGCCFGCPTTVPWAIHFPAEHWTKGAAVHPTQIYESAANLLFFGALAWLFRRRKFDGQVFAAYLIGYSILRAILEAFRGDYTTFYFGGKATPGQAVSVLIFAAGAALWWRLRAVQPKAPPAAH